MGRENDRHPPRPRRSNPTDKSGLATVQVYDVERNTAQKECYPERCRQILPWQDRARHVQRPELIEDILALHKGRCIGRRRKRMEEELVSGSLDKCAQVSLHAPGRLGNMQNPDAPHLRLFE